tara:strand:+ start:1936 stop:4410 length:2475 start_codon:yes stop_codon:yes gene_type:complete
VRKKQPGKSQYVPAPEAFGVDTQVRRIGPKFDRLAALMDASSGGLELRPDPTALAPERLLVFEVRGSVLSFANAIRKVPGLELIDEEAFPEDNDDKNPAAYLLVPNDAALRQVLSLWRRWVGGQSMATGFTPWREVFSLLRDIRTWGPQDRISESERDILDDEIQGRDDTYLVPVEIELVFRRNGDWPEASVSQSIIDVGGRVVSRARIDEIAYHAILAELPVQAIRAIIELRQESIGGLDPIQHIRPQSLATGLGISEVEAAIRQNSDGEFGEPILALIDGVPVQRHPWLAQHIIVDDVFDLEPSTPVDGRSHGTAMASLIVHGDHNNSEAPIRRKVIAVPVLGKDDQFPPNQLVVDLLYRAILSLRNGPEATGRFVTIVNISLGNRRRQFHGQLSPWARLLDRLAYRLGILFLVSAGNITDEFSLIGFSTRTEFEDAKELERSAATIKSVDALKAERRLLSPGETVNGITIGSRNFDWVPLADRGSASVNIEPYAGLTLANPSSAMGPGFAKSVKPDLLYPGSRELLNVVGSGGGTLQLKPPQRAIRASGLKVAVPPRGGLEAALGFTNGTSAAAALASRTAHRIHDALEYEYGQEFLELSSLQRATLLKALLVHPAAWDEESAALIRQTVGPSDGRQHVKQKDNIRRFLGYGSYDLDDAVSCATDRATFWAIGEVGPDQVVPLPVPIPSAFGGKALHHSVSATLAWMTPVNSGRQAYRAVRLKLTEPTWLGSLAVGNCSDQPDQNQMNRGTIASRRWSGDNAAVVGDSDTVDFEVSRLPDTGSEAFGPITFSLVVTISMPTVNEIYQQVKERVRPVLRQRI